MAEIDLPDIGEQPWAPKLLASIEAINAEQDEGRLSPAELSATFARPSTGTVAVIGDSIPLQGYIEQGAGATLQRTKTSMGFFQRANVLLRQRLTLVPGPTTGLTFGGSGKKIREIIDGGSVAALIAAGPEWAIVHWGTNSAVAGDVPAATIFAEYVEGVEMMTGAGIKVVATTILPRVVSAESTSLQRAAIRDANFLICQWARSAKNVVLCDWAGALVDASDGNGLAAYFRDYTHPNAIGISRMAKVLADTLETVIPPADTSPAGMGKGIMSVGRSLQSGTGGSFSGSNPGGASGSTAQHSVCYVDTGTTLVASKVARSDVWPGSWVQFAVSAATATGGYRYCHQNAAVGVDWSVGDSIYAEVEFETDAASWAARFVYGSVTFSGASGYAMDGHIASADLAALTTYLHRDGVIRGLFRTPIIPIPTGATRIDVNGHSGGGAHTIRWGRMQVYKV